MVVVCYDPAFSKYLLKEKFAFQSGESTRLPTFFLIFSRIAALEYMGYAILDIISLLDNIEASIKIF